MFIWLDGQTEPSRIVHDHMSAPYAIFVTKIGEIYVDAGAYRKQVQQFMKNTSYHSYAMEVDGTCAGLFVDINDTIYCSLVNSHKVIKRFSDRRVTESIIAAGNGSNMSTPYTLNQPYGIFVDLQFKLYVTDRYNDRIQVFQPGNLTGQTILGNGSNRHIQISHPIAILVNSDEDMFILECREHRLLRVWYNSFTYIIGCNNLLSFPSAFSFDTHGNIFVMDWGNSRLQKFRLNTNSCKSNVFTPDCKATTPSGIPCNDLKSSCKMMNPCKNGYVCNDNHTEKHGYSCLQSSNFTYSVCDSKPCWNNGLFFFSFPVFTCISSFFKELVTRALIKVPILFVTVQWDGKVSIVKQ